MKITPRQYAEALIELSSSKDLSKIAEDFWFKLQKENSYKMLAEILESLDQVFARKNNKQMVRVHSSNPLSDDEKKIISDQIKLKYKKDAYIKNVIEPGLEIGYRIETENEVFDNSFKNKISKLKSHIS